MLRWLESRFLWGALLILGGVMFLLQNLGFFQFGDLFWALLLGLAGVFFLSVVLQNQENWWALIPGFTLFSIALQIVLSLLAPRWSETWGGLIVLGGIGLSFLAIYWIDHRNWWAVIPGGTLLTLGTVAALATFVPGIAAGGVFFLGLGLTFGLVALLPEGGGALKWAWIPSGILILMGSLFIAFSEEYFKTLWPLILILAGSFLLFRTLLPRTR